MTKISHFLPDIPKPPTTGGLGESYSVVSKAGLTKTSALFTERLSASALAQVFLLDIVSSVAVGVIVMHVLLGGMPRRAFHNTFRVRIRAS